MDPAHRSHQRLEALVVHDLPLPLVKEFLDEKRRGERERPVRECLEKPSAGVGEPVQRVVPGIQLADETGEHDRVPALVGDLGVGVLDVVGGRVPVIGVPDQHLHQDGLEPDAADGDAGRLLPAQLPALFLGELVPQVRAVQRDPVRGHRVPVGGHRGVPVNLGERVI